MPPTSLQYFLLAAFLLCVASGKTAHVRKDEEEQKSRFLRTEAARCLPNRGPEDHDRENHNNDLSNRLLQISRGVIRDNTNFNRCSIYGVTGLGVDGDKERRRLRRARKKWKATTKKNAKYSLRVGGTDSPFYRTTSEETSVEELFSEIKQVLERDTEDSLMFIYDFTVKYHRKIGYPRLIQWGYYETGACMCTETKLKVNRLRMQQMPFHK